MMTALDTLVSRSCRAHARRRRRQAPRRDPDRARQARCRGARARAAAAAGDPATKLGALLVTLGVVAQRDVAEALAAQLGLPLVEAAGYPGVPDPRGARLGALPARVARAAAARGRERARARDGRPDRRVHDRRVRDGHRPHGAADGRAFPTSSRRRSSACTAPASRRWARSSATSSRASTTSRFDADVQQLKDLASEAPVIRLVSADHHQRARDARVRHPHRAVREPADRALPHRRRAARGRVAAASACRRR